MAIVLAATDLVLLFFLSFFSSAMLLVFFLRRGWGAMPLWHRVYVVVGLPLIIAFHVTGVINLDGYLDADSPVRVAEAFLSTARVLVVWWGFAVCLSQMWMLLHQPN